MYLYVGNCQIVESMPEQNASRRRKHGGSGGSCPHSSSE